MKTYYYLLLAGLLTIAGASFAQIPQEFPPLLPLSGSDDEELLPPPPPSINLLNYAVAAENQAAQTSTFRVTKNTDPESAPFLDSLGLLNPSASDYDAVYQGTYAWAIRSVNETAEGSDNKIIFVIDGANVIDQVYNFPAIRRKLYIDGTNLATNERVRINGATTTKDLIYFVEKEASGSQVHNLHVSVGYIRPNANLLGAGLNFRNVDNIVVNNCMFTQRVEAPRTRNRMLTLHRGVEGALITNNTFGTNADGTELLGEYYWHGIDVWYGTSNIQIGNNKSDGNTIVNCQQAIQISGDRLTENSCDDGQCVSIQGNLIGTGDGDNLLGFNYYGVDITAAIDGVGILIGGDKEAEGNTIFAYEVGVMFFKSSNTGTINDVSIYGNIVGKADYTSVAIGGRYFDESETLIFSKGYAPVTDVQLGNRTNPDYANLISGQRGVVLDTLYSRISVSGNDFVSILLSDIIVTVPRHEVQISPPTVAIAANGTMSGTGEPNNTVEIYRISGDSILYEGSTTVDGNGSWTYAISSSSQTSDYTAIAIDSEGNTSVSIPEVEVPAANNPGMWLEAECATVGSNWNVAEDANAAGGKYLTYPSGTSMNSAPTNPADHVTFSVVTATAGSYHLQARIRAPSGSNDSFWFKVNDGDWIKWWQGITRGTQFNWNTTTGSPFTLTAGNHTITVAYRESGTQLDKLYLSSNSEMPDGLGDVDSTCVQPLAEIIIDNADPGFSTTGSWSNSTQQSGNRYGPNYVHDGNTGKGSKTATFSASVAPGTYEVYGWWSAYSNRATNVPYDIVDACGTNTVLVNQRTNGASWQLLGTYTFGQTAQVTLRTDGTDAYVIADAVKLTPLTTSAAPDSVAVDNAGPGFSTTGSWSTSTTTGPYYQSNYAHDQNSGKGSKTATFQATVTPGSYEVFAWWSADGNRATNVPFDVVHQAGTSTVVKDQRQQGGQWVPLGTYDFGTTAQVTIRTTGTDGYVMADGVLFVGGGSSPATPCDTVPDDYDEVPGEPLAFRPQWGGNVAAMVWSTFHYELPVYQQAYTYDYSPANRLTEARYASQDTQGGWTANQSNYSVHDIGYDANGNITGLTRYTADPVNGTPVRRLMDQLSYTYAGNRVQAVSDAADAELGFADGASNGSEYGYDANGNLTRDDNKGITNIAYDPVLDVPLRVDFADGARIDYLYDAAGNRLAQTITAVDGTSRTTDYVGAVEYRDDQLALIHHPEGRVVPKTDGSFVYHYDLRDHLGNVRLTFSEEPMVESSELTMETPAAPTEEALFEHVAAARQTLAFHNTTDASSEEPEPNKVARLQAGQTGPAKSLSVRRGDKVHLQVNAAYETGRGKVQGLEGIATEVAGAASRSAAGLESSGAVAGTNGLAAGGALTTGKQQGVPPAYLNYLVYNEQYQLIDQGFVQVSEEAATQLGSRSADGEGETLALDVAVKQNGFLYAYLSHDVVSNGSPSATAVYFDDFEVAHEGISIVQHNDYYAFGAVYQQSADRVLNNAYLYQGKELQDGLGLDLYDFHARQYDPFLGRFTSIDPAASSWAGVSPYTGMVNNPISYVDPDGRNPFIFIGALATVGAGIGGGIAASKGYGFGDAAFWQHVGIGALGGAAVGTGAWYFAPQGTGLLGGHGGSLSQLFGGTGQAISQVAGGSVNLAQQVFQGVGPTVGADAALQMFSNGPPTNDINRFLGDRPTWDPLTNQRISELNGTIRDRATEFINQVEQQTGIQLRVSQGLRTIEEQNALYAQGRTTPGNIVTNARGGESYHNYGLAFDVVEMVNGTTPNWNTTLENWNGISDVGQNIGLEWGGNWTRFVDRPHFQRTSGLSIRQLQRMYGVRINIR